MTCGIEVEHLSKSYGGRLVLDDVTFRAPAGSVTAFLGPNGAGKTTAMRLILGLDRPDAGAVRVNGRALRDHTAPLRQVGALLDAGFAHPKRTAYDHLRAIALTHGIREDRVLEVLEETGLESVAAQRAGSFSLGMTQRLGIAAALLGRPHTLLLDEPINGLDVDGIRWFRGLCARYAASGRAVFLSSHLMSEVELVADRVVILARGRVAEDSALDSLRRDATVVDVASSRTPELAAFVEAAGGVVATTGECSFTTTGITAATIGATAAEHGIVLERLAEVTPTLEEHYRMLTDDAVDYHAATPAQPSTA